MKLTDIKPGLSYKATRREIISDTESPLIIGKLPSFCATKYYVVENLDTKEGLYILVEDDLITDVTKDFSKAVDIEKSERVLDHILGMI